MDIHSQYDTSFSGCTFYINLAVRTISKVEGAVLESSEN